MKHSSQDDLLGYVLGALDAQQQRDLQNRIDSDPELEEKLLEIKSSLVPLDYVDGPVGVRPGLARRTCELVAGLQKASQESVSEPRPSANSALVDTILADANQPPAEKPRASATMSESSFDRGSQPRSWSITDVVIGIAACAVLAGILLPAISYTKHNSEVVACQQNLQTLGRAFQCYSEYNDGHFVEIPEDCRMMGVSGSYAPMLKAAGLVDCDSVFACAGVKSDRPVYIPLPEQVRKSTGYRLVSYQRTMGGHYGYTLGHMEGDSRCSPGNLGRSFVVVLADQPSSSLEGRRSRNHRDVGQNCLFEDGRVQFVTGHAYGEDPIYLNEYGIVGPGCRPGDNVIAPSHLSPVLPISRVRTY